MRKVLGYGAALCLFHVVSQWTIATEPTTGAGLHYYHFKEQIPLTLDSSRVAVRVLQQPVPPDFHISELSSTHESLPIQDWYLTRTAPDGSSPAGVQSAVSKLSVQPVAQFASPVFVGLNGGPVIVTRDILIAFQPNVSKAQAETILAVSQAGIIKDRDWAGMRGAYRVETNAKDGYSVLNMANSLAERPEVLYAEPDMIFTGHSSLIPNDPLFTSAWGIHNTGQSAGTVDADMDGPEAWDITTGSASIKVLILDVGVQQNHPDINQLPGADFTGQVGGGGPVNACDNHGTAVAGCVSAKINNALGTVGIAPSCKSVSARFAISTTPCNGGWSSQASWTVNALAYGESIGVRVTNNSNYYGFTSAAIDSKYDQMRNNGIVHFASAGNDSQAVSTYPASLPTVNSIAALERHGNRASFSNYGVDLFASAPGQSISSTDRTGSAGYVSSDYVFVDGTSFASPYTAGVAALVLSVNPTLSAFEVETILAGSAVDLGTPGWDTDFGWGFINAYQAVLLAVDSCAGGSPDCNSNGLADVCDVSAGTSQDCNSNGIPDECEDPVDCQPNGIPDLCDIALGNSLDVNGNNIPDECEVFPPQPDPSGIDKSRFVSFELPAMQSPTALRVTMVSLHHVNPPYSGGVSVPFTSFEGQVRWVGPPDQYVESNANPVPFYAASLQCFPYYQDWSTVGLLHVTGSAVAPSSVYEVVNVSGSCQGNEESCTTVSTPLVVNTTRWGDVETPYSPPNPGGQPDFGDVAALINKFKSAAGSPIKARALLAGDDAFGNISANTMNLDLSFAHISACVDAFKGKPYPYSIQSCP